MTIDTIDPEQGNANGIEVERTATAVIGGTVAETSHSHNDEPTTTNNDEGDSNGNINNKNGGDREDDKEAEGMSLEELIYGASSFYAVVKPVSVTMILAALAVIYINTEETKEAGEQALDQTYQVFSINEDQSAAKSLGLSLVNSLIIVCVIGAMTFLIVLLYKYRCMKCLIGYMVVASTMLLGFLGGQIFNVAINKYALTIDWISFLITMYNFAIVGVVAVFYQKGIPTVVNQSYLVATSVIVAWQLSYFNDWMAWALLIMLALYDLFAVLTPCGPLKALVNLMSKEDAPMMPGLLYEAQLPENATRPGRQKKSRNNDSAPNEGRSEGQQHENNDSNESGTEAQQNIETRTDGNADDTWRDHGSRRDNFETNDTANNNVPETRQHTPSSRTASSSTRKKRQSTRQNMDSEEATSSQSTHQVQSDRGTSVATPLQESASPTTTLPLAIAKVYKLPILSNTLDSNTLFDTSSPKAYLQQEFSAAELQTNVEVRFPRGGGKIETTRNKKGELRYVVYNKDGEVKRTLCVGENGKAMEITYAEREPDKEDNTIKLGLGDFIFYSVLVSKAAENGFAAFVSCFLSILAGLGGTLVLLAVYHHALPALPISIFLAVIMFVLTIYCMEPYIQDMWRAGPYYV